MNAIGIPMSFLGHPEWGARGGKLSTSSSRNAFGQIRGGQGLLLALRRKVLKKKKKEEVLAKVMVLLERGIDFASKNNEKPIKT